MEIERIGERRAMPARRSHVAWYFSGYPDSASLRRRSNEIGSFTELEELLRQFVSRYEN
jgi:tRNA-dihydrouridine synthase